MSNILNHNRNIFDFKLDLDFDSDEVKKYDVGNTLPVAIFLDSNNLELERLVGEKKVEEIENVINKYK